MKKTAKQPIDFVITWVDGQDKEWRRQRAQYSSAGSENDSEDDSEERYRDWGLLKYWFRGVEKFAPWVRKIHFVTWGHYPSWLNVEHSKLHIVRHDEYIPENFLPTFDCNVIETHLHRIEGLAEHFVNFNDDVFLLRTMKPTDFFHGEKPCDMLAFQPVIANPSNPVMSFIYLTNTLILSKYFKKRENVIKQPWNYFHLGYPPLYFCYNLLEMCFPQYTGFYTVHGPAPFCKKTFQEIWEKEGDFLNSMSEGRFRHEKEASQYLFREWQKLSGNFHAKNVQKYITYLEIQDDTGRLERAIESQKSKVICINDAKVEGDPERIRRRLQEAFERILPEPSSFELRQ